MTRDAVVSESSPLVIQIVSPDVPSLLIEIENKNVINDGLMVNYYH